MLSIFAAWSPPDMGRCLWKRTNRHLLPAPLLRRAHLGHRLLTTPVIWQGPQGAGSPECGLEGGCGCRWTSPLGHRLQTQCPVVPFANYNLSISCPPAQLVCDLSSGRWSRTLHCLFPSRPCLFVFCVGLPVWSSHGSVSSCRWGLRKPGAVASQIGGLPGGAISPQGCRPLGWVGSLPCLGPGGGGLGWGEDRENGRGRKGGTRGYGGAGPKGGKEVRRQDSRP